jgi:phage tail sheath protein FI
VAPPPPAEDFKPCAPALPAAVPEGRPAMPEWRAPRFAPEDYALWSGALAHVLDLLGRPRGPSHRRDVMLVGALPLPLPSAGLDKGEEHNPLLLLSEKGAVIRDVTLFSEDRIGNARLQLAYPWVATEAAANCPEGVESPEGVFAGLVAKQALAKGAFHSAAGQEPVTVRATVPPLDLSDLRNATDRSDWLGERISLIGTRHGKLALLSDATMADSRAWRPGGVSRLMNIVLRAARHMGQEQMFEPGGPQLWSRLRGQMERFLDDLAGRGALTSLGGAPPYEVRCDRSTMTQSDIDAGRAIMEVGFTAAYPVVRITVSLNLVEPTRSLAQEAA